jgi:NAD(P)-dependent dehydrogenase (short-subunit alcohol dehydrogenase family)
MAPSSNRTKARSSTIPQTDQSSGLEGRVVLVTGASRGIGLAIAQACARAGAHLALVARDHALLKKAAGQLPGQAHFFAADVSSVRSVESLFKSIQAKIGRLDVLINNAGVFTFKPFVQTTLEDWQRNIGTNLTSLFLVTRAALPLLERSRSAHIVNVLSVSSRTAFPKCSAYSASKFGALGFTRVLAQELRPKGVRVTAVLPGSTSTRMMDEFDFKVHRERLLQPEDVAAEVLNALLQPRRANVDEILLMPSAGAL